MSDEQEKQRLWKIYMIFMGIMVGGGAFVLTSQWIWGAIQENNRKSALQNSIATASPAPIPPTNATPSPNLSPSQISTSQAENPFEKASYPQSACGDPLPANTRAYPIDLYPVFIAYSDANLQAIKTRFCTDAIRKPREKKNIESVQVASFISIERANLFRDFLIKNRFSGVEVGEPSKVIAKPNSIGSEISPSPTINEQQSRQLIISLYLLISQKEFSKAASVYSPNLAKEFDVNFFRQFQRVTVDELSVALKRDNSIVFQGLNTYIWSDGSSQQEKRSYIVGLVDGNLKIIGSEFVEIIRLRST